MGKNLLDGKTLTDLESNKKILLFDIETAPNIGAYFELYKEGNIVWNNEYWYILCFSYKWLNEKETHVVSLPDFKSWKKNFCSKCKKVEGNNDIDFEVVQKLWELFDEADIIVAHNGDAFDIKKSNARFIKHHLPPPSPYKTVDTKLVAKRYFKFDSNKLDDLADYFKIGRKLETEKGLWKKCMEGNKKAWKSMKDYNIQDTVLLEKVYLKMRGWMKNHPNMNLYNGTNYNCPNCGSLHVQRRGYWYTRTNTYQRFQCMKCHAWSSAESIKSKTEKILR